MKAARLYAYDEHMQVDLTLEMVPEPTITAADEVIVRDGAAGLCRTDLHIIEKAVNAGIPFAEAFAAEGGGDLATLRETFLRKGFLSRQARLLRRLKDAGLTAADICALRIGDLSFAGDTCLAPCAGRQPVEVGPADTAHRYLQRRADLGLDGSPTGPLITDLQDQRLTVERLEAHVTRARTVRLSLEANGALCRAVLAARQTPAHDMWFLGPIKSFQ